MMGTRDNRGGVGSCLRFGFRVFSRRESRGCCSAGRDVWSEILVGGLVWSTRDSLVSAAGVAGRIRGSLAGGIGACLVGELCLKFVRRCLSWLGPGRRSCRFTRTRARRALWPMYVFWLCVVYI